MVVSRFDSGWGCSRTALRAVLERRENMNQDIRDMVKATYDPCDKFAWVQSWRFAICEVLLFDWGTCVPGFRTVAIEPEDSTEVECLRALYAFEGDSIPPDHWYVEDDLLHALKVLDRYRNWLAIAGEDY